jgi:hypothetical protein
MCVAPELHLQRLQQGSNGPQRLHAAAAAAVAAAKPESGHERGTCAVLPGTLHLRRYAWLPPNVIAYSMTAISFCKQAAIIDIPATQTGEKPCLVK